MTMDLKHWAGGMAGRSTSLERRQPLKVHCLRNPNIDEGNATFWDVLYRIHYANVTRDEDYFASPDPGTIATKTTVEVTTGPLPHYASSSDQKGYANSELSVIELQDKPQRSRSPGNSQTEWPPTPEEIQFRRT